MSAYAIALSGLDVQSRKAGGIAQNVANRGTTGRVDASGGDLRAYLPVDVVSISAANGGVKSVIVPVEPATTQIYAPDSADANKDGLIEAPNISLEEEMVDLSVAKNAYKANVKVLSAQQEMDKALFDIFT